MGDIADMMIDGTLDCETGEAFDDIIAGEPPPGYPRTHYDRRWPPKGPRCPVCGHRMGGPNHDKGPQHLAALGAKP